MSVIVGRRGIGISIVVVVIEHAICGNDKFLIIRRNGEIWWEVHVALRG